MQRHPKIITFNRLGDNESLMNPLKERTATTNAIKTLFICSALLVGFMSMSLGLSQTASATAQGPPEGRPPETPQCPPGSTFNRGECTTLVCPPETDVERDDQCFVEEEIPRDFPTCPNSPFTNLLADGKCHPNTNPNSQGIAPVLVCPPETDVERGGECFVLEEVDKVCPPETDFERGDECIDLQEEELEKIPETSRPGRGNN